MFPNAHELTIAFSISYREQIENDEIDLNYEEVSNYHRKQVSGLFEESSKIALTTIYFVNLKF